MKKILLICLFSLLGVAPFAYADAPGTADGSACDLPGSPAGTGDGILQSGSCVPPSSYQSQSGSSDTSGTPSGFKALAPIPGLTDSSNTSVVNSTSLANFINNLYKYLIGLAAMIAIIEIIWGGLEYSTQDSVSKHADGKERIQQAILGLVLVLAPVIVFSIINPSILNLSLNLPVLNTASKTNIQTPTQPLPTCINGQRTNCTPPAPTQMGNYATPTPGLYCFERTNPDNAPNDFVCHATLDGCTKLFNDEMNFGYKGAISTCKKY